MKVRLSTPMIDEMIRAEGQQVKKGIFALEANKELKANHFTTPQLKVVSELAKKFVICTEKSRQVSLCTKFREQMDMVNRDGRIMTDIEDNGDFKLNGPGAIISSIGDSLQVIQSRELLSEEYEQILGSIAKYGTRGLPSIAQFSKLSAADMNKVLNSKIYPHVARIIEGLNTPDAAPSSEDLWNKQTKCEKAIGYRKN